MKIRVALLLVLFAAAGCVDPSKIVSLGSYNNAVSFGTQTELQRRGIELEARPTCHSTGAEQVQRGGTFTVRCDSTTVRGQPVVTEGRVTTVGTQSQQEQYTVKVAGETVLRSPCLGAGCRL